MDRCSEYKDSGIEWIGEIPRHWRNLSLKYVVTYNDEVLSESTDPKSEFRYIEISDVDQFTGVGIGKRISFAESPSRARRILRVNDVLISTVRTYLRAIGTIQETKHNFVGSTGFCVLRATSHIVWSYLSYFVRTEYFISSIVANSEGVSYPAITSTELVKLKTLLPPIDEQILISEFLDKKTFQIDSLIEKLQQKIELLKEYRTAIISQCVTKGLDCNVEMKDSGIEWIGEIPEHWIVNRISRTTYVKGRIGWKGLTRNEFTDIGPYLITGTDFLNGRIDWSGTYHVNQERYQEDQFIIVQKDDVLITKDGTIGKIAHIVDLPGPATLNSGIFVTRPLCNTYQQRFFYWVLNSKIFTDYVDYSSSGTTIRHLYQNVFEFFVLPIPNHFEQIQISQHLDQKNTQIDSLIEKLQQKIELHKEYRQSLISNVVTGKVRVPELAK